MGQFLGFCQRIVRVSFPELNDENTYLNFGFSTALEHDWYPDGLLRPAAIVRVRQTNAEQLVTGPFAATEGRFRSVVYTGPYVDSPELESLTNRGGRHPDWTDGDISQAVKAAGARFSPGQGDAFLQVFGIERFAAVLGPIRRVHAGWSWRGRLAEQPIAPMWLIVLEIDRLARGAFVLLDWRRTNQVAAE